MLRELRNFAGSRIESVARDRKVFLYCLLALVLVSAIDAAILAMRCGPDKKIGPNQIRSPWRTADAPPQCVPRSAIRVVSSPKPSKVASAKQPAKRVQRAAFAPFGPLRTEN